MTHCLAMYITCRTSKKPCFALSNAGGVAEINVLRAKKGVASSDVIEYNFEGEGLLLSSAVFA